MKRSADQLPDYLPDDFNQPFREILIDPQATAEVLQYAEEHGINLIDLIRFSLKLGFLVVFMGHQGEFIQEVDMDTGQAKPMSLSFDAAENQAKQSWRGIVDGKTIVHISFGGDHKIVLNEDLMDEIRVIANSYRQEITVDQIVIAILNLSVHILKGEESGRKEYYTNTQQGPQRIQGILDILDGPDKF